MLLKTILLHFIILFCCFNLSAQKESNIKLKIEAGGLLTTADFERDGLFLNVEPKLKTSKNTFIGLRIGASSYGPTGATPHLINRKTISIVPTFDYCFFDKTFSPYLGIGVGYYFLDSFIPPTQIGTISELSVDNQIGILLRGGFYVRKFVVELEFNYIPKTDVEQPKGQIIGTVSDSYIGLSLGYEIGIGKRTK